MGKWKQRMIGGPADGQSQEDFVRQMMKNRVSAYVLTLLPPVVDLYDRIEALEARVRQLEGS